MSVAARACHTALMNGATGILIKLGVRLAVFGVVFFFIARRNPKVVIPVKWATPLVALVFALLNTGLYWALKPILNLATLGALGFFMPLIVNMLLLIATVKFFAWHRLPRFLPKTNADHEDAGLFQKKKDVQARPLFAIDGIFATLWLALVLTIVHGALWVALDYLPNA